jgi:hypothetical protein
VSSSYTEFDSRGICSVKFGKVENLPEEKEGVVYIVSGMVASACKRGDIVSPATGHPQCKRENGNIISVPGFVQ